MKGRLRAAAPHTRAPCRDMLSRRIYAQNRLVLSLLSIPEARCALNSLTGFVIASTICGILQGPRMTGDLFIFLRRQDTDIVTRNSLADGPTELFWLSYPSP
jgi:hypothetical protein